MHFEYAEEYGKEAIKFLENGRIRYYGSIKLARSKGEMLGARYVHEFNRLNSRNRGWIETLDHNQIIRQVRPQFKSNYKKHYLFDQNGNLEKIW